MALSSDHKKVVYWAEDDLDDMQVFRLLLLDLASDYDIVNFQNGKLLVNHMASLSPKDYPNLIVLDMNMPVMNGIDALKHLSNNRKYDAIPKVIFTTSNNEKDKAYCESINARMLTKPFTYNGLNQALKTIISYARETA